MNKKYYIHTFGCQMNVHDSGKIAGILQGIGYAEASSDADADVILFNTCTVRDHAHHKAISEIGRAVHMKKKRPGSIVGVCGCVAQEEREHLFEIYPELDLVFGPDQIHRLPELLRDCRGGALSPPGSEGAHRGAPLQIANARMFATELVDDPNKYNWKYLNTVPLSTGHCPPATAFVTIMKGCNNVCSFCIVPHVRGREISRPADDIIKEIKWLGQSGVKEVTLLGQNVNSYKGDSPPSLRGLSPFTQLLRRVSAEISILRIRYTSPHPKDLGDDLIEEHATNPKLCRHMHLPLQAGSDSILRAMKRSYNKRQFIERALKLRERASDIEITTDIIVGFPGETEGDYQETLDVVRKVAFDGMYAFKYSPRPRTKAAELKDNVPLKEKENRLQSLLELNAEIWKEKTAKLIGTVQEVLVEGTSRKSVEVLTGRTFGNKIVNFAGNLNLVGHIVPVKITFAGQNSLKGELNDIC